MDRVDVRDLPPAQRHERSHGSVAALDPGEALVVVNDHDPSPSSSEFEAEIDAFDGDGYRVEQGADDCHVATLPRR